jgi:hypothetical protein
MASLKETLDLATAESTTIDSVIVLLQGVQAQIQEFLSGQKIAPSVQQGIDDIFNQITGNKGKLDAALQANVP